MILANHKEQGSVGAALALPDFVTGAERRNRYFTTAAKVEVSSSLFHTFDVATRTEHLRFIYPGSGPVPGVAWAENIRGEEGRPGLLRRLTMNDGSIVVEEVIHTMRPLRFTYRAISGLPESLTRFVRSIVSDWTFIPYRGKVEVVYEVHLEPVGAWAYPIVFLLSRFAFRGAQERCLAALTARIAAVPDETY